MREWWQEGDGDDAVAVPRRDQVPDSGFTDPRIVTTTPQATPVVAPARARRIVGAGIVTALACGLVVAPAIDLVRWTRGADPIDRAIGLWFYVALGVRSLIAAVVVWRVWAWARRRDARDTQAFRQRSS